MEYKEIHRSTSGVSIDMPPPAIPKKKANRKEYLLSWLINKSILRKTRNHTYEGVVPRFQLPERYTFSIEGPCLDYLRIKKIIP